MTTFSQRYFYLIASLTLSGYLLMLASSVVNPIMLAIFFAILLAPIVSFLQNHKIPKFLAVFATVLLSVAALSLLVTVFAHQFMQIDIQITQISAKYDNFKDFLRNFNSPLLDISAEQQANLIQEGVKTILKNSTAFMSNTIRFTTNVVGGVFLFFVTLLFLLFYKDKIHRSFNKLSENKPHMKALVKTIKPSVQNYCLGLALVITIVAFLNSLGLWLLGIENALLFGLFAAFLTIIPYFGIILGALLPILFALVTKDSLWYPVGVVLVFISVQLLEGNVITPFIIGDKVNVNPYAAILGLIIGGTMFGIVGLIVAMPILATVKIILDESAKTKPISDLIG